MKIGFNKAVSAGLALVTGVAFMALPVCAQPAQSGGMVQSVPEMAGVNIAPSAGFGLLNPGPVGFAAADSLSNNPSFLKANAIPAYVTVLQSQFQNPIGLIQSLTRTLSQSHPDAATFLFQTGPARSIAGDLLRKANDQPLGSDAFMSASIGAAYRDAVRRTQVAAFTAPAGSPIARAMAELEAIDAKVAIRGNEIAQASEGLRKLNEVWDQSGGRSALALRDSLNDAPGALAASVRADVPRAGSFAPSGLRPAPRSDALAGDAEMSRAISEIAPRIFVHDAAMVLAQLHARSGKDQNFARALGQVASVRPLSQSLLADRTFLLNSADRQEPNLLRLLQIDPGASASGHLRIIDDGRNAMMLLIVTAPHRGTSTEQFKRILENEAVVYEAIRPAAEDPNNKKGKNKKPKVEPLMRLPGLGEGTSMQVKGGKPSAVSPFIKSRSGWLRSAAALMTGLMLMGSHALAQSTPGSSSHIFAATVPVLPPEPAIMSMIICGLMAMTSGLLTLKPSHARPSDRQNASARLASAMPRIAMVVGSVVLLIGALCQVGMLFLG